MNHVHQARIALRKVGFFGALNALKFVCVPEKVVLMVENLCM